MPAPLDPECPRYEPGSSLIYPVGKERCRHWIGGITCRLPEMELCRTRGLRRQDPEDKLLAACLKFHEEA